MTVSRLLDGADEQRDERNNKPWNAYPFIGGPGFIEYPSVQHHGPEKERKRPIY